MKIGELRSVAELPLFLFLWVCQLCLLAKNFFIYKYHFCHQVCVSDKWYIKFDVQSLDEVDNCQCNYESPNKIFISLLKSWPYLEPEPSLRGIWGSCQTKTVPGFRNTVFLMKERGGWVPGEGLCLRFLPRWSKFDTVVLDHKTRRHCFFSSN